jgi:hypothetical protein
MGIDMSHWAKVRLRAVENTERVHNVIVCTLCSCYPVALLGPSPTWYKSLAYRSRVVLEPRAVLAEFGLELDPHIDVRVWDSTAELRYIVVPRRPVGTDGMHEEQLAKLAIRSSAPRSGSHVPYPGDHLGFAGCYRLRRAAGASERVPDCGIVAECGSRVDVGAQADCAIVPELAFIPGTDSASTWMRPGP